MSVFRSPWWLEAATNGRWAEQFAQSNGVVRGHFLYSWRRGPFGLVRLGLPPLTPWLGPWIDVGNGQKPARVSNEIALLTELIERLPRFDYFCLNFSPAVTNWLPFYWAGFQQTTRYTYIVPSVPPEMAWAGFTSRTRQAIRKAQRQLVITDDVGVAELWRLVVNTFTRQGKRPPYGQDLLERVVLAAYSHRAGKILGAADKSGRLHAAIFLLWDATTTYYLVCGTDSELRDTPANAFLLWEAIRDTMSHGRVFDFEGSMHRGIERFFRGFGGEQVPYSMITRANRRAATLLTVRDAARALRDTR